MADKVEVRERLRILAHNTSINPSMSLMQYGNACKEAADLLDEAEERITNLIAMCEAYAEGTGSIYAETLADARSFLAKLREAR